MTIENILLLSNMVVGRNLFLIISLLFLSTVFNRKKLYVFITSLCKIKFKDFLNIPFVMLVSFTFGMTIFIHCAMFMVRIPSIKSFNLGVLFSCSTICILVRFFELKIIKKIHAKKGDDILDHPMPTLGVLSYSVKIILLIYSLSIFTYIDVLFPKLIIKLFTDYYFNSSYEIFFLCTFIYLTISSVIGYFYFDKINDNYIVPVVIGFMSLCLINIDFQCVSKAFLEGTFNAYSFIVGITIGYQITEIFSYSNVILYKELLKRKNTSDSFLSLISLAFGIFPIVIYSLLAPLIHKQFLTGKYIFFINDYNSYIHLLTMILSGIILITFQYFSYVILKNMLESISNILRNRRIMLIYPLVVFIQFSMIAIFNFKLIILLDALSFLYQLIQFIVGITLTILVLKKII